MHSSLIGMDDVALFEQRDHSHSWIRLIAFKGLSKEHQTADCAVVVMVIDGRLRVTMNKCTRELSEGEMFLIPYSTTYQAEILEDTQVVICRFTVDLLHSPDYPLDSLAPWCRKNDSLFAPLRMVPLLWNFSSFVHTCLGEGIDSRPFYERKKLEFFDLLFACYSKKEIAALLCPVFREGLVFRRQVIEYYQQVKTLDELIERTGQSRSAFYRNFALYFAKSPYDWMLEQKAIRIRRDLMAGVPPKEVTYRYDFSSMSHLTQFCRKHFGMPPSQISKNEAT